MATGLNKDVIRESTVTHDERLINVTLGSDQTIKMKLKGMKSGEVEMNIKDLYLQLCGCEEGDGSTEEETSGPVSYSRKESSRYVQPPKHMVKTMLNDLRSQNAISLLDTETMCKFDSIVSALLKSYE